MARTRQTLEKKKQEESQQSRSPILGFFFLAGIIGVIALAVYFFVIDNPQPLPELNADFDIEAVVDNSVAYESVGRDHIADDVAREYNSNPPTSGAHNPRWVRPNGTYTSQFSDTLLIHNLEHGHVWLSYRDEGDEDAVAILRAIQEKYSDRVIVTYRPENDTRIAVAAWTRLLTLEGLDSDQIEAFIVRYSDQAPESILEG
ncbi:MAG: DUF3105 domain-containing protein [Phototrophicaceae bacterium]